MMLSTLTAISPLDGRYFQKTESLQAFFSEYGLIHYRLYVEIRWLQFLNKKIKELSLSEKAITYLTDLYENFNEQEAEKIKIFEKKTQHDIKAIEYYLKEKMSAHPELAKAIEFVHFACTSDDINNLAYALILLKTRETCILPLLQKLKTILQTMSQTLAPHALLARTHGQPTTPTTMGKEFSNTFHRLTRQYNALLAQPILGKINGAVGNFNAHHVAYPELHWPTLAREFTEQLGLTYNSHTTQIEPHDYIAEYSAIFFRINTLLIDLARDCWGYISLNYFSQKKSDNEVGSSTMPHKINPIDFENAEGNLRFANALWHFFSEQLPVSRWQRDLVDSTIMRNLGVAHGHSILAYEGLIAGLNKLTLNTEYLATELNEHWEVLTEAIQTVMRRYGLEQPYERLKDFSRGKKIDQKQLHAFIDALNLPAEVKITLKKLTPANYLGFAVELAQQS